jgi:hypothetical protein
MSFKLLKPQPTQLDESARFGRCAVHPASLASSCNGACTPSGTIDEEETVRLSDEQLPVTSVTRAHRPDWLTQVTSFLRVQGPTMVTGIVLGFSFFTMTRMPLGSSNAAGKASPHPVAAAAIDPTPVRAMLPAPPPAWDPAVDTIERAPVARAPTRHRRKARHADRASCDPPYRYDADGIKRIKLKCL